MVMIMVMNDPLPPPLCNVNRPSHSEIQLFQNLTMKIHGQGHVCGQSSRSHLTFKIQRSRLWSSSNPLVTFEAWINQSINQSNPVLLKERVRIPRTRRAGGAAMLWRRLPLDGVGSCRLFFTDDLHDNLSWVPASDKPHTFKSCFTHSSQVFFGRPGPFLPGTGLDLTLFISPLERMTCPNHLSRRSRTRMARSVMREEWGEIFYVWATSWP